MTVSNISLPWLSAALSDAPPAVWGLWGAVAVCYLLLFFAPSLLASHGQKNVGTAVHAVLLAVLLLLHVGGIYAMLMAEISLSWVLAALLSSAVIGISLGRLQEILFSRPGETPADASGAMTPAETETEAEAEANAPDGDGTEAKAETDTPDGDGTETEANAPDGDGTEAEAETDAPDSDGTEAEAETDVPDGGMSGDVPPEADSAPTDDGKEAHDAPAMPDTADAAEEETASAAPDRTEKGAQDR